MDYASDYQPAATHAHRGINPVTVIIACAGILMMLGITILYSASVSTKQGPIFHLYKQLLGIGLGCGAGFVISRLDLEYWRRHAWKFGLFALFLLFLVLEPHIGIAAKGSRRWLGYGAIRFQISELGKFAMAFCLAHYLAGNLAHIGKVARGYLMPLGIITLAAFPVALETDLGTAALIFGTGLIVLFLAGAKYRYLIPTAFAGLAGLGLMIWLIPNRLARFTAFLDVEANKLGGGWQLDQSLVAFAAGGLNGAGLGQGRQQINFLPEAHTDFIAAIIGEEIGLYGTLTVVALLIVMFVAAVMHLRRAPNMFQYLFSAGCIVFVMLQALINLYVVTGCIPTKGMSLPFISYGISNLIFMGMVLGVLVNNQRNWPRPALSRSERLMQEVVQT